LALFNEKQDILVGTNAFRNDGDVMKEKLERDPFVKNNPRKTLIAPIIAKRLAEEMEQARLEHE
jgi:methylmalonyl-CoA mutase